jgi:DNA polymerase-3 subunit delta'
MHHAWLLHGAKGIGKATFAYRAARFMMIEGAEDAGDSLFGDAAPPQRLDSAPDHPAVRLILAGSHPDLFALEGTRKTPRGQETIAVEEVRSLIDATHLTIAGGGWRVVIVDATDNLNRSSANTLLKLIEEPPPQTVLFIISHQVGGVLPTIRSRCLRLPFGGIDDQDVARILAARRADADAEMIGQAVRLSAGSPGRGMALLDGGGSGIVDALVEVLDGRRGEGGLKAEAFAALVAKDPFHYAIAGEALTAWLAGAARPTDAAPVVGMTDALTAQARHASRLGPKPWLDLYQHATARMERTGAVNLDPVQVLVDILLRIQALLARA